MPGLGIGPEPAPGPGDAQLVIWLGLIFQQVIPSLKYIKLVTQLIASVPLAAYSTIASGCYVLVMCPDGRFGVVRAWAVQINAYIHRRKCMKICSPKPRSALRAFGRRATFTM